MARLIEFSVRSTKQLQKILAFYDERNGSDTYSRRLMQNLMDDLQLMAKNYLTITFTTSTPLPLRTLTKYNPFGAFSREICRTPEAFSIRITS